nr:hypothetical protein [Vibrio ordalii]
MIGKEVDASLSTRGTELRVQRLVVTNEIVLGKKLRENSGASALAYATVYPLVMCLRIL